MMNEEIFLKECHDFIDEKYAEFCECKKILFGMLDMFHDICTKNGIRYYLGGGSLLGIVRDGNPVPWDPDIDVIVPMKEIPKLLETLKKELPDGYYVESDFYSKKCDYYQTRIGHKDYPVDFVHLDIFYLTGAPADKAALAEMKSSIITLSRRKMFKSALINKKYADDTPLRAFAKKWYYRLNCGFRTAAQLDRKFEKLMKSYDCDSAENLIIMDELGSSFPAKLVFPLSTCEKYGHPYPMPARVEEYEDCNYKNFREILPIRCRFHEFYDWMCRYKEKTANEKQINFRAE